MHYMIEKISFWMWKENYAKLESSHKNNSNVDNFLSL